MQLNQAAPAPPQQETVPFYLNNELKLGDRLIATIPIEMEFPELLDENIKTSSRWTDRKLKKNRIIEDVVFNPVDGLVKKSLLMPQIQYGQGSKMNALATQYAPVHKSKWGQPHQKTFKPPMLNYISPKIPLDELEYIIRLLRLDEINSQMSFEIPDDPQLRSPSPDPVYNSDGTRVNTRAQRKKNALEKQRINLIEDCMRMKKNFRPPQGYRRQKKSRKIYINGLIKGLPGAKFIGKVIGPSGHTQKLIEARTGCKISVRGRGSSSRGKDLDDFDQLHFLVQAQTDPQVEAGSQLISKVLMGTEDLQFRKENQQQIALMKGIFDDNFCQNCSEQGHRTWACTNKLGGRVSVKCSICGELSHAAFDCPMKGERSRHLLQKMSLDYSKFQQQIKKETKTVEKGLAFITQLAQGRKMLKPDS